MSRRIIAAIAAVSIALLPFATGALKLSPLPLGFVAILLVARVVSVRARRFQISLYLATFRRKNRFGG